MTHSPALIRTTTPPEIFRTYLTQSGSVPLVGLATPRAGMPEHDPGRAIGAVAIALDPTLARRIVALAEVKRLALGLLGEQTELSIAAPTPFCLKPSVYTTCADVLVRASFEEADECGELIIVDPADLSRTIRAGVVPVDFASQFVARVTVSLDRDVALWTLMSSTGAVLDVAPLPLATVRQVAAAALQLGLYGNEPPDARIQIVHEIWKGHPNEPTIHLTRDGAGQHMLMRARDHQLTLQGDDAPVALDEIARGTVHHLRNVEDTITLDRYAIPLAEIQIG